MLNLKNGLKLLTLLLIFTLLVGGCTNTRNDEEEFKTSTAALTATIYLDTIINDNSSSALAVEDQIDLSNVEITLTNTDNPNLVKNDDQDVSVDATEVSFKFDDLNLDDTYKVDVKVKDDEGHYVYQGSDEVVVSNVNANYSLDELTFLKTKNVVVNLSNLPSNVDGGMVSLVTTNLKKEAEVEVDGNTAKADFSGQNLEVGEYDLKLSLTAKGKEVFSNTKSEILVLPNQVTKINLDCKNGNGGLGVSVLWESPPEAPKNLSAQVLGGTKVELNWSDEGAKYNIYRSLSKDFAEAVKVALKVEKSEYFDQNIEGEQDYYYWVEAVSEGGISSDKIGPRKASIPKFSGIKVYYYTTKEEVPTIVVGTQNGKKITEEMGYSKEEPAKMKIAADAPKNWYSFKIADKYLPQNEVPLVVRFAGAEKGVNLSPVETAWYDGSKWNSGPPTKIEKSEDTNTIKSQNQGAIWENRTAYYLLIDRFYNSNPKNDNSYGRPAVDAAGSKVGTFHGGDIAGVTQKIKAGYFDELGINTLCISAPYEQIHGSFAKGENEEAAHYAYDGYYVLDYTTIDKNVGTVAEFREFVTTAHKHGLRVVMDVVLNHPGYSTIKDMKEYNFGSLNDEENSIDKNSTQDKWSNWWGPQWVRANLPGYNTNKQSRLTKNLNGLADFKTEVETDQGLPPLLETKWQQEANNKWTVPAAKKLRRDLAIAPRSYLIQWITAWVEEFGIDGFRARAVPYVGQDSWAELKSAAQQSLQNWRKNNPQAPGAKWDEDFWLLAKIENKNLNQAHYYQDNNGDGIRDFDAVLNPILDTAQELKGGEEISYLSSLKRGLGGIDDKITAANQLLLSQGGVQIFYGDEINKQPGEDLTPRQSAGSDYPWQKDNQKVLKHWQKLGQFREKHPAVGAGEEIKLGTDVYGRRWDRNNDGEFEDKVVIKTNAAGKEEIRVKGVFKEGTEVHNFYTGETAVIKEGWVEFEAVNEVVLIERVEKKSVQ